MGTTFTSLRFLPCLPLLPQFIASLLLLLHIYILCVCMCMHACVCTHMHAGKTLSVLRTIIIDSNPVWLYEWSQYEAKFLFAEHRDSVFLQNVFFNQNIVQQSHDEFSLYFLTCCDNYFLIAYNALKTNRLIFKEQCSHSACNKGSRKFFF